jgi:tetratricopeptide (TPR) repeat protein
MEQVGDTITSLLGARLAPPLGDPESRGRALALLAEAERDFSRNPGLDQTIWYGRRAAYLGQYARAIAIYSEGIARFPDAHQLYRHRGHRYISTRQLALAVADLERAADLARSQPVELEPDGIPNARNQPLSTTHFNIWYHLGLAHYLQGHYESAAAAYRACMGYSPNDDCVTATSDWLFMTYGRLGERAAAQALLERIHPEMDLVEDHAYHRRLLMYKGLLAPEDLLGGAADLDELTLVTQGYGVGNWFLLNGDAARALAIYDQVLATGSWSAFGYIAAEVDVLRLRGGQ